VSGNRRPTARNQRRANYAQRTHADQDSRGRDILQAPLLMRAGVSDLARSSCLTCLAFCWSERYATFIWARPPRVCSLNAIEPGRMPSSRIVETGLHAAHGTVSSETTKTRVGFGRHATLTAHCANAPRAWGCGTARLQRPTSNGRAISSAGLTPRPGRCHPRAAGSCRGRGAPYCIRR